MSEKTKRGNTMLFDQPDIKVCIREMEDGDDIVLTVREMYDKYAGGTVYMKLCAYDKYQQKRSIWRPCKVGAFIEMDLPPF